MTVLITGATGFVGQAVAQALFHAGQPVVATVRQLPAEVAQARDSLKKSSNSSNSRDG